MTVARKRAGGLTSAPSPSAKKNGSGGSSTTLPGKAKGKEAAAGAGRTSGGEPWYKQYLPPMPIIILTIIIGGPALGNKLREWYHLQSGLVRPAVRVLDKRQLLIVGTLGSGTLQMTKEFHKLGIEMAHENSDALHRYARDGTISWIHAARFLGDPTTGAHMPYEHYSAMCTEAHPGAYHPTMFYPSKKCSYYSYWDKCWMRECGRAMYIEYACHHTDRCLTPFERSILQVRHPLKTVASLLSKAGMDCKYAKHQLSVIRQLFPNEPFDEMPTCAHKFALFWLAYNRAVKPHVDAWYRVEHTPPCEVAALGGFMNSTAVVYEPHFAHVHDICSQREEGEGPGHGEEHGYVNRKNVKRLNVTWADLDGTPEPLPDLRQQVEALAREFGYEVPTAAP